VRNEVMEALWEELRDGEHSILYSTHLVNDLQRFADDLVFLKHGKVAQRSDKVSLEERWRRLSFPAQGEMTDLAGAVEIRQQNSHMLVISSDVDATLKDLRERGLEHIEQTRLSMEEIAVSIMKEER
jgi:ABC-2 type transport system ATP-binding protein